VDTTITTLEFCAGYGGIGLGLKNIFGERMRTIAYCELEGFAQANLLSKMEKGLMDVAPIWNDLKTFPYESFHGLVDILVAGYPCQPFSSAGKRAGKEDPRHLWPWIADGIRLLQPRMCFFENVEGHISLGLSTVISDLEELGYKSSFGIFSAAEVGAVHQRKRVFIMAHNKSQSSGGLCKRTQTQESKFGFNCEAELADTRGICSERANQNRANRNWICELSWESKIRSEAIGCGNLWPSRPGQPQYAWEPPRVVGNAKHQRPQGQCDNNSSMHREDERIYIGESNGSTNELGNSSQLFCHGSNNNRGVSEQREQIPEFGNSSWETTVGNAKCRRRAGRYVNRETTKNIGAGCINGNEAVGNATSERPCGGSENEANQQPEMLGTGHEAMGESECSEIKPEMGRDIDGTTYGMDISELSGLSNSELAEIREWMVRGDNRTDELRSCGSGVVPATAERAFRVLMEELINK